ncbi:MAG: ABC transporter substrate-binding protein, partial [Nitrososphaerales archaeon]
YVVDRSFFINSPTLLGGQGIPGISPYAGEPDQLVVSNVTAKYSGYLNYSIAEASAAITPVLTAHGAVLTNGKWTHNGTPVTVYVFDRTDDPIRHVYAGFLETQLADLGFTVSVIAGDLSKEISVVYGADPVNSTWTILPESWGGIYGYYDESLAASFTGTVGGYAPYSDTKGLAMGSFNDTGHVSSSLINLGNQADQVANNLFAGNFNTTSQRDSLLQNLTNLSFLTATRIYLGTALNVYGYNPSLISNLTPNFVESPVLNSIGYMTMSSTTGKADIGVRYLSQGSLNPIAGFTDSYSVDLSAGLVLPLSYYQPSTGYPFLIGANYKLNSISDTPTSVPSNALIYNSTSGSFSTVGSGATAKTVVTVNFAPLFASDKWADGQPITLADLLYQYVIAENVTFGTNSPIYDTAAGLYAPGLSTISGFQILNSTSIKVYSSYFYPDSTYAAESAATAMFPLGYALPGGGMFPWQLYQAMASVVGSGKAAWSSSAAQTKSVDWLSLTNSKDVAAINTALSTYGSSSYIPAQLTQLQSMSNVSLVNSATAQSGYTAAGSFISSNGNAMISDGPFYLSTYQVTSTPNYAILTKSQYFNAGSTFAPQLFAQATSITTQASPPSVISQGSTFNVTTLSTVIGSNTSNGQSGVSVTAQFVANNAVALQETVISASGGTATISIPSSLAPGTYTLIIYSSSSNSTLIQPVQTSITVTAATTSSSSSFSSSSSTSSSFSSSSSTTYSSTTPSTPSSNNTLEIIVAAVIIVVIIVGVVFAMRRRSTGSAGAPATS